jgi:hypothetical protein
MLNQRLLYAVLTLTFFLLFHISAQTQSEDRSQTLNEIASLRKQLAEKEKLFLSPSAEDLAACAEFLKQPKTGLIRLFPGNLYVNRLTLHHGGASYSFFRSTHEPGMGYDIGFDKVSSSEYVPPPIAEYNFIINSGLITELGDVPLEKITLDHKGVKFLEGYLPANTRSQMNLEYQRAYYGIGKNGYIYKREVLSSLNYTYVLRSIIYNFSDVLVAFRVIRKEIDGSVVIIWKLLKQFPPPNLDWTVTR